MLALLGLVVLGVAGGLLLAAYVREVLLGALYLLGAAIVGYAFYRVPGPMLVILGYVVLYAAVSTYVGFKNNGH